MLSIGNLIIKNRVIAAPMAGVTDKAQRIMARNFGCGMAVSEMISDMGLIYGQKKTLLLADTGDEEKPLVVQIFGSDPDKMAAGAIILENMGADIIDINMGCPTPKIVKNGEGSALMLDLPRSRRIIRSIVQSVSVPVTVKMRRGWDDTSFTFLELAGLAEAEGAAAVTLHARSRSQFYSGQADWSLIKQLKAGVSIPVIGNGDIWRAEDALKMLNETGCDAVMIGRGAMGNPFIFREAVELIKNGIHLPPPEPGKRIAAALNHLDLSCRFKGEAVAVREMRKHFSWYIKGMEGAAKLRGEINQAKSKAELVQALVKTGA